MSTNPVIKYYEIEMENIPFIFMADRENGIFSSEGLDIKDRMEKANLRIKQAEDDYKKTMQKAGIETGRIVEDANEKAKKILSDAEEEKNHVVSFSQAESEKITADAKNAAEQKIKEALGEYESIRNKAREEGYNEGVGRGFDEGRSQLENVMKTSEEILNDVKREREKIMKESEKQLLSLSVRIAEKIIKEEVTTDREIILNNITSAVRKIIDSAEITIRVNPDDSASARHNVEKFMEIGRSLKNISFVEDRRIKKGGCLVETEFGNIDATIDGQLEKIGEKFGEISDN